MFDLRIELKKVALKVQEILHKLGLIADYVVEIGTSDSWSWVKWNSGRLDIKAIITNSYTAKLASGYGYYNDQTASVPADVPLLDDTIEDVEIHSLAGSHLMSFPVRIIDAGRTFKYWSWCTAQVNTAISKTLSFNITGKWK